VTVRIPCPTCGERPHTEFTFGGQARPHAGDDTEADFARVFLPDNDPGSARERWFHTMGCRTWFELTRDATTNRIG
jgi:heterotetrameric sarcosine oxidase delta subunit